jgi:hypothetical protein
METVEAAYPWEIVNTDIMGPLPTLIAGNTYIIVFTVYLQNMQKPFPWQKQMQIPSLKFLSSK